MTFFLVLKPIPINSPYFYIYNHYFMYISLNYLRFVYFFYYITFHL